MLYTVTTDDNSYILSVSHTDRDDIELDLDSIDVHYLNAYRVIDSTAVLDEERKAILIAQDEAEAKEEHKLELKQYLKDTDYVVTETFEKVMSLNNAVTFIADFIKIMIEFKNRYSSILEERAAARQYIDDNTETK